MRREERLMDQLGLWDVCHGSEDVMGGKLKGATDTDYFYFLCPKCGGNQILKILDFVVKHDGPVEYAPKLRKDARRDFTIAFELKCGACGLHDIVKVSNIGWQDGKLKNCPRLDKAALKPQTKEG